ncbi:MAG: RecQ family ATP-dependent DNA helicase [Marinifilaceae bacterium]
MNKYEKILKKYWGYSSFRPLQLDIINSIASGKDTLALMPTGGGKSLTFQVPAMDMDGMCIVITPLIALMKDQVENLQKRDIPAVAIYTGLTYKEITNTINRCLYGDVKFLYISPERLASEKFINKLQHMKISFLAVDEAHCISQWGYDFRPSYLKIKTIRELFPNLSVLALTATATLEVVDDIQERLEFKAKNVFRKSFERENLSYVVRQTDDKDKQLWNILQKVKGSAIVYVRSRRRTKEISEYLETKNISCVYYNAGLSYYDRNKKQELWMTDKKRVIVATNAFGMGIDKPDVRIVVHYDVPDNIESYFQEAGRAGRDGERSYAVMLYNKSDDAKWSKRITDTYPEKQIVLSCYESLASFLQVAEGEGNDKVFAFDLLKFSRLFKFNSVQAYSSLKLLQASGYLDLTDEVNSPTRLMFIVNRDALYHYNLKNQNCELLVKIILRTYTGLFVSFVKIDEEFLCDKLSINKETLYEYFGLMSAHGIIQLIPQRKTPYISYTQPRLPTSYIKLSKAAYVDRREKFENKIEYIKYYASSIDRCRSSILVEYFGEEESEDCGNCDVCLKKKKIILSAKEEKCLRKRLLDNITEMPIKVDIIIKSEPESKEYLLKAIAYLLEEDKVYYNSTGLLCVNKE